MQSQKYWFDWHVLYTDVVNSLRPEDPTIFEGIKQDLLTPESFKEWLSGFCWDELVGNGCSSVSDPIACFLKERYGVHKANVEETGIVLNGWKIVFSEFYPEAPNMPAWVVNLIKKFDQTWNKKFTSAEVLRMLEGLI